MLQGYTSHEPIPSRSPPFPPISLFSTSQYRGNTERPCALLDFEGCALYYTCSYFWYSRIYGNPICWFSKRVWLYILTQHRLSNIWDNDEISFMVVPRMPVSRDDSTVFDFNDIRTGPAYEGSSLRDYFILLHPKGFKPSYYRNSWLRDYSTVFKHNGNSDRAYIS